MNAAKRRICTMAQQILKGKAAGDIPIHTAEKGTVVFNAKTVKELSVDVVVIDQ